MKIIKIILFSLLVLIVLGIISGGIFIRYTSTKGLPDYQGNVSLSSISSEVLVLRDSFAIPHVFAETEDDLYRSVGYIMAQDRLWQMDLLRRLTTGRLSEIFGKDLVEADLLFRSLNFTEKSKIVIENSEERVLKCLEAFADGVNQFILEKGNKLPPEFTILGYKPELWEPFHSVNLIGYMSWGLTMSWNTETVLFKIKQKVDEGRYLEMIPDMDLQKMFVYPDLKTENPSFIPVSILDKVDEIIAALGLQVFQGSNNWAVAGKKSVTGGPLMANDMHLDLNTPGIWYQMHHFVEGELNVTGVVLPGQPFIICGHNEDVAWGMTNVMLDDIDFYIETLHSEDSAKYLLDGNWVDLMIHEEIIKTKGGDSVKAYNRFTHRGPIVSEIKGFDEHVISMRWIGMESSNELLAVYKFNRMKDWSDFRDAAKDFVSISQNIVYADKKGNIGMQTAAGVPIREGNPAMFFRGDTSLHDWKGLVPFEELPFSYNPEIGYVASANNRLTGDDYPYYISCWYDLPGRYEVITEELAVIEKLSLADFAAIQANQTSKHAQNFTRVFVQSLQGYFEEMSDLEKEAFKYLSEWDYNMNIHSVASTLFETMYIELIRAVFLDEIGEELLSSLMKQDLVPGYLLDKLRLTGSSAWTDNINTPDKQETFSDNIIEAFTNAVTKLTNQMGSNPEEWEWGKLHTLTLKHPLGSVKMLNRIFNLNRGPFPVGGSYHTVSPYSYPFEGSYEANHGSSHRHIYSTANWDNSLVIIPTGICGVPASDHYCDQTSKYLRYEYHNDIFSRNAMEKKARYRMIISGKD